MLNIFSMYLLAICTSSSEKSLCISDARFWIGSLNFGWAVFFLKSSLYFLDKSLIN